MDRRKKILVNKYEVATEESLQRSSAKQGARVFAKVRIADALDIERSGLTDEEYSYALKAHFDFVVTASDMQSLFAVEFDGIQHSYDVNTLHRDKLKNTICDKLGIPLLRIDHAYLKRVEQFACVLDWLVEMWFMEQAWNKAYDQGDLSEDADFYPYSIFEWGYIENSRFVAVDITKLSLDELTELTKNGRRFTLRSYDPFASYQIYIRKLSEAWICLDAFPKTVEYIDWNSGYSKAIAYVQLPNHNFIVGTIRCRVSNFITGGVDLARNLAIVDCTQNLLKYRNGEAVAILFGELEKMKQSVKPKASC